MTIPESARALLVSETNGTISSAVVNRPVAEIGGGPDLKNGVVIKTAFSSINYKDMLAATGGGKIMASLPTIAGIDGAGVVIDSNDARFKPGDEVLVNGCGLGERHDGGLSEIMRVSGDWIVPLPAGMSMQESMAIGTAGFSAGLAITRMLDNGLEKDNGPVAVTGATGGVGSLAVDMLASMGFEVHAITNKKEATEYLKGLGASEVIIRDSLELQGPPLEKARWAGAIDNLGGQTLSWLIRSAKPFCPIASIGLAATPKLDTFVFPFILRGVSLLGVSSSNCPMPLRQKTWQNIANEYKPTHLSKSVVRTVTLDQLDGVFSAMQKGRIVGRTVVKF